MTPVSKQSFLDFLSRDATRSALPPRGLAPIPAKARFFLIFSFPLSTRARASSSGDPITSCPFFLSPEGMIAFVTLALFQAVFETTPSLRQCVELLSTLYGLSFGSPAETREPSTPFRENHNPLVHSPAPFSEILFRVASPFGQSRSTSGPRRDLALRSLPPFFPISSPTFFSLSVAGTRIALSLSRSRRRLLSLMAAFGLNSP